MRVTRTGPCIGQPSRCRGGTCSCCPDCGDHRWNFDGTKCLSPKCSPLRERIPAAKKAKPKDELPSWARTKPRTKKQQREAVLWARSRGLSLPWDFDEKELFPPCESPF